MMASKPGVAVINEALARKYFVGQDPIGQKIADDEGGQSREWEIVGVVDDVREGPLDADIAPTEYFPIDQTRQNTFSLVVRTRQDAVDVAAALVSTLHQIDPNLGASDEATMSTKIDSTQAALLHRSPRGLLADLLRWHWCWGSGALWSHCVFGEPAHAGDWRAHGAWSATRHRCTGW